MRREIAHLLLVPIVLLAWARIGAPRLTLYSWDAVAKYRSPYLSAIAPGGEGDAVSRRVVVVVVDALRADASRTLPTLNRLREAGADRTARTGQPSLSYPSWTVIGTGAWQEQSEVTTNFYKGAIPVDTIFEAARRKGLTTAIVGSGSGWPQLYARGVDVNLGIDGPSDPYSDLQGVRRQDDQIEAAALRVLAEKKPDLLLVHLAEPDNAGHARGAASREYADAIATIGARIGRLVSALDLRNTTILVTGDHGMLDRGGHGGWESEVLTVPLLAAGAGVRPGRYAEATQADVAPTVAVLLGTSIPAHNQGRPLFDMLDLPEGLRARRALDAAAQLRDRYAQYAQVIGAAPFVHRNLDQAREALAAGQDEGAYRAAMSDIEATWKQASSAKAARLTHERLVRLPIALLVMLPFAAYMAFVVRNRWDWRAPLAGTIAYTLIYQGLYFGRGYKWSLSAFNTEEQIMRFFTERTVDAMIALLIAAILVGALSRRVRPLAAAVNAVTMAFMVAWWLVFQIGIFYFLYDVGFAWYLPDLAIGFKYYLDVLQTGAFWPLTPAPLLIVLPFAAIGARWVAARVPAFRA
ncbi:MAG: hypothetical protein FJX73_06940 [Armatimonadetes bacterium]|nr:hypothetical protein [Armatimonadota bacterium]